MREILFRGKRKDTGAWVFGDLVHSQYKIGDTCVGQYGNTVGIHQVNPETVGRFTGLTDKNGTKIFEGDVCKVGNLIYKVVFEYSAWRFKILSNKVYCCPAFNSHCGDLCEVIGNIHDNPELLEV